MIDGTRKGNKLKTLNDIIPSKSNLSNWTKNSSYGADFIPQNLIHQNYIKLSDTDK